MVAIPITDGTIEQIDGRYVLRFERRLPHPRQKVWEAITRPERLREWLLNQGDIELDLVEGGKFVVRTTGPRELVDAIIAEAGEEALVQHHTVLHVEPPAVFEHTFGGSPDSVVRWELRDDGDACRLTLIHTEPPGFPAGDAPRDLAGWHSLLELIEQALDGNPGTWRRERWQDLRAQYAAKGAPS